MTFNLDRCPRVDCGEVAVHPFDLYKEQTIALDDGEQIRITSLYQFLTYEGLLCGMPGQLPLSGDVDNAVRRATKLFPYIPVGKAAIFAPTIRFGFKLMEELPNSFKAIVDPNRPKGKMVPSQWEMLPQVTCIAVLSLSGSYDSVLAIWWQDEIGWPDENALKEIRTLRWADHAVESNP